MVTRVLRIADTRLVRYGLASVGALAVDLGAFLALLALAVPAAAAGAFGYAIGIAAHWLLSSRAVFADTVAERGQARNRQKALFVLSALVGLALTTMIVGVATFAGIDPRLAKLAAIVISFAVTWMLRNKVVFRASEGAA
ncbi:GtrA-like protein [Tsuneonella dongtanensis]|uniref:GtrA-like protein n=1 Tax=Tsuneonella dongtanensis TaxID=692370 RepID=A0A1B2AAU9_9SPHN|nr:GtrA family protein [Tsuneonella dongtanensis]ANY19175.1 GtrA-like protein [Tsuneonella dongtanensis]